MLLSFEEVLLWHNILSILSFREGLSQHDSMSILSFLVDLDVTNLLRVLVSLRGVFVFSPSMARLTIWTSCGYVLRGVQKNKLDVTNVRYLFYGFEASRNTEGVATLNISLHWAWNKMSALLTNTNFTECQTLRDNLSRWLPLKMTSRGDWWSFIGQTPGAPRTRLLEGITKNSFLHSSVWWWFWVRIFSVFLMHWNSFPVWADLQTGLKIGGTFARYPLWSKAGGGDKS